MPHDKPHYRAFISYSHRDAKWAKWLHKALEQYHVPIDAYPPGDNLQDDGSKKSRRLTPVFRDRDELPASGSLADTIQEALEASENLIVLCSPNSVASQYVNAEIEIFRGLLPENDQKVYALIVDGDPPDCFPAALTAGGAEPIAADAREEGDGKADAKLKLIAGLLGVGFDRLKRREATRQRNRLLIMVSVISAVAVMTSFLAVWALKAEKEATKQKVVAEQQRELAVKSEKEATTQKERAEQQRELAKISAKEATAAKVVAENQRELAVQSEKAATTAKEHAEQQRELAEQATREAKAVLAFFNAKVLAAARPKQQDGGLGIDATIRAAIDAAEPQISTAFNDQPAVEATIRTAIGTSYWYLGEAKTAIPQLQRALALRVKLLGPKHLDTLKSMTVLANSYQRVGRREEALELRGKTLQTEKEILGPKHPDTLTSASNLAVSYRGAGRFKEALALDEETLKLRKEVLGPDDPDTISSMGSLASSYSSLGRQEEALKLREQVLELFKKSRGEGHPDTLNSMQNLANSYETLGREKEAQALREQTLKLRIEVQGPEHPDTLRAKFNMANSYISAGHWDQAIALHQSTLQSMIQVLGPDHRETIGTMNSLAYSYWKTDQLANAEKQYRQLLAARKRREDIDLGFYHAQSILGEILAEQKNYPEAETLLLAGYKGMESLLSKTKGRERLKFAIERLVTLYQKWDKPESTALWLKKHKALEAPAATQ